MYKLKRSITITYQKLISRYQICSIFSGSSDTSYRRLIYLHKWSMNSSAKKGRWIKDFPRNRRALKNRLAAELTSRSVWHWILINTNGIYLLGVQGWLDSKSTRLPPMWLGFDSQLRRQMWVEFLGSLLCTERISPGTSISPLVKTSPFDLICVKC